MKITGQCHCAAIKFEATADPEKVLVCHCKDCQSFSGAPFRAVVPVPKEQVVITGTPRVYVKTAASGNHRAQAFCGECGSQLYATEPDQTQVFNFRLGCVNERADLPPKLQIWQSSAMPWLNELDTVPAHSQGMNSPLANGGTLSGAD